MRVILSAVLLLCLPLPAGAQSVELPAEVKADVGTIAIVAAKTDCPELQWVVIDPGLSLIPPSLLKDSRTAVVMSGRPGRYRLLAYGALKDRASAPVICTVVVGEAPPGPNPPGPNPPGPNPPSPDATLSDALQKAMSQDTDADKLTLTKRLAQVYRQAITSIVPSAKTVKEVDALIRATTTDPSVLGTLAVPNLRSAVGAWLKTQLPTAVSTPLDEALRQRYVVAFTKLATALEGLR